MKIECATERLLQPMVRRVCWHHRLLQTTVLVCITHVLMSTSRKDVPVIELWMWSWCTMWLFAAGRIQEVAWIVVSQMTGHSRSVGWCACSILFTVVVVVQCHCKHFPVCLSLCRFLSFFLPSLLLPPLTSLSLSPLSLSACCLSVYPSVYLPTCLCACIPASLTMPGSFLRGVYRVEKVGSWTRFVFVSYVHGPMYTFMALGTLPRALLVRKSLTPRTYLPACLLSCVYVYYMYLLVHHWSLSVS